MGGELKPGQDIHWDSKNNVMRSNSVFSIDGQNQQSRPRRPLEGA